MTNIWFFNHRGGPAELINVDVELHDDYAAYDTDYAPISSKVKRSYSFNYNDHHYPHYKWGVDMWHTREEAILHRREELIENVKFAVKQLSSFEDEYGGQCL